MVGIEAFGPVRISAPGYKTSFILTENSRRMTPHFGTLQYLRA